MATIRITECPICKGTTFKPKATCVDNFATKEHFSIEECTTCGFGFTVDFPSETEIGKYYDVADYVSHSDTQKGVINSLYHLVRKIALKSKRKLVVKTSGKKTGQLLDIGSGTGYFLNEMKSAKWVVTGIEKAESARKLAKSKFDVNSQNSDYLFEMSPKAKDVITLWHVLEHLEKLNETMECLNKTLKDDGVLLIALPNKQSYDAIAYQGDWAAYDVPRHLWHFSPNDFEMLANNHGFRLEKIKPMYFDIFYISMLSEKNKGTALATIIGLMKGGVYFLKTLFNPAKCSSVIYILKKK